MTEFHSDTPVVMSLSSHDPSGSAGIQADIETTASLGCHCTPIITALTAKDTQAVKDISPVETGLLIEQARAILEDMPVRAIKLGLMGSVENIEAVHTILRDYPDIPVVLDPVTAEFNNELFNASAVISATAALLMPLATIATPDLVEAHDMALGADTVDACAQEILETGCQYVLISGSVRNATHYENSLYGEGHLIRHYKWPRIRMISHGCGATLAASIASYLAHGLRLEDAVQQGQNFTWHALAASRRLGMGCFIPNRMHWADKNGNENQRKAG
ncbi:bifunctional hydroxymethylpyrimidine kinase/phosphomethylpyrimidine kinase [Gilvimarinus sp. F26214L]|uniref:bifunctional hydroxymethylpyrimidine kinase/phosphomethylpyrimidine kinase n=1 Tax=Gilvimarinus sp. DZF01 TaxID=3461371 RepID=UPI004045281D